MSKETSQSREIELKFDVTDEQMRRLRGKKLLGNFADGKAVRATLHSTYYDTVNQALRERGMSLRVRRKGDNWVQTAKIGRGLVAGLSNPIEIEHRISGPGVDIAKLKDTAIWNELSGLCESQDLRPVFETVIFRTTRLVRTPCGAAVEIAFDRGRIDTEMSTCQIREVELELSSGKPSSLFRLAEQLTDGEMVRFSEWSKAERGYRLCSGQTNVVPEPQGYVPPDIYCGSTATDAFAAQLRACARQIAHNWKVVLDSNAVEGPHQLRIGLRRLRSVLRAYRTTVDSKKLLRLDRMARRLAAVAGRLRDADVLVNEIASAQGMPDGAGFSGLQELLEAERGIIRCDVRDKLAGDEMMRLLLKLGAFIESPKKQIPKKKARNLPAVGIANSAIQKSWNKVEKKGRDIAHLTIDERHSMRKSLKELRYQIDAFANLYPSRKVKPFCRRLKALQGAFGYLNDVAMAEQMISLISAHQEVKPEVDRAAGFVLGWHMARSQIAWRKARRDWRDLAHSRKFWKT